MANFIKVHFIGVEKRQEVWQALDDARRFIVEVTPNEIVAILTKHEGKFIQNNGYEIRFVTDVEAYVFIDQRGASQSISEAMDLFNR